MRKALVTAFLVLSTIPASALARDDDFGKGLDDQVAQCSNHAGNTLASVECLKSGLKAWDAELNRQYKQLLTDQPEDVKASVKKSQLAWLKYRDSYLEAMQTFYKQQSGTIWGIVMADAELRLTRDKAIELYKLRTSTDLS
ncbi:lysozyme inhibitor LprI family protein [Leclercia adecarboxylata]